jgi:hypothetical protein
MYLNLAGSPALLRLTETQIVASIDSGTSVPAPPPSKLAPGLTVLQALTASGANQGLCGNLTVESLAQVPVPEELAADCASCSGSHTYTFCGVGQPVGPSCNSLLDVAVGGCGLVPVFGLCGLTVVNATQPDVPATPGGIVQQLSLGANNKVPASVTTGDDDGYSTFMTFDANRAHLTGQTCTTASDCQSGMSCVGGRCAP